MVEHERLLRASRVQQTASPLYVTGCCCCCWGRRWWWQRRSMKDSCRQTVVSRCYGRVEIGRHLSLPLVASVLKPDLHLCLSEVQQQCESTALRTRQIALRLERRLQLLHLTTWKHRPCLLLPSSATPASAAARVIVTWRRHVARWRHAVSIGRRRNVIVNVVLVVGSHTHSRRQTVPPWRHCDVTARTCYTRDSHRRSLRYR